MTRCHHVKKARKNYREHGIKKGEPYFWWKFKRSGKQFSKTRPRRSQLTRSEFWGTVYNIQDDYNNTPSLICDVESQIESIKSQLEELRDETQSKLDNLPQSLQEAPSGQTLTERIESLEAAINEIEAIDYSYDGDHSPDGEQERCDEIWQDVTPALDLSCS